VLNNLNIKEMKQIFCPDTAIVENKDTTVSQKCTIYTNDESIVTLITPKVYPKIGDSVAKDSYYFQDGELLKCTTATVMTVKTIFIKVATDIKVVEPVKVVDEKVIKEITP
jgi:hypothetical protein